MGCDVQPSQAHQLQAVASGGLEKEAQCELNPTLVHLSSVSITSTKLNAEVGEHPERGTRSIFQEGVGLVPRRKWCPGATGTFRLLASGMSPGHRRG